MNSLKLTKKQKAQIESLGLFSKEDLVNHFPFRYHEIKESNLAEARIKESVVFSGIIVSQVSTYRFAKKTRSVFKIKVDNQIYNASIFNRQWINKLVGIPLTFFGSKQSNESLLITNYNTKSISELEGIVPVYHLNSSITNDQFRKIVVKGLSSLNVKDNLPQEIIDKYDFIDLKNSYLNIHYPSSIYSLKKSIERLKYQQLFFFNLKMLINKVNAKLIKPEKLINVDLIKEFISKLPYKLNAEQLSAVRDILEDLSKPVTMYRLLQGDVGSGKTIVGFVGMYANSISGFQSVLLAPTEILALQHYQNALKIFDKSQIIYLSSSLKKDDLQLALNDIEKGEKKIIIGTHRLFQDDVKYYNLGLVITDEQQRFGVKQRESLINKGISVDILQMSATPIPRTIAQYLYADMDISYITIKIKNQLIVTKYVQENSIRSIQKEVEDLLDTGKLCFIVCASIDKGEKQLRDVTTLSESLKKHYQDRYKIDILHSKVDNEQQSEIIQNFIKKKTQILISTTIIEVGVDIKDADILILYDAQQFGLSQIHQLRGRVGRHSDIGHCFLLSKSEDPEVVERLNFIAETNDGFKIAEYDFYRRGFGDIVGVKQSGKSSFALVNSQEDLEIIKNCFLDAKEYLMNNKDINIEIIEKYYY